jgi:hypothetical protein
MNKAITNSRGEVDYIELTAIELASIEAQRLADFEASWLHKDMPIRVLLSDANYLALLIDYPEFAMIRFNEQIPVEAQLEGNYLYLQYINDEDRQLFEYFGATIENYTAL